MIRRPPRPTLSSSSAASDVYKRQFWDCYADITHDSASDGWMVIDGTWISVYHALLYYLQGRRVLVDVPDGKGNIVTYKGRCWVSSYTTDEDGRIKATIGYSLAPPEDLNL